MALFKKKEEKSGIPRLPELPELPELPQLPESGDFSNESIPELPSFPSGSLGNKFSQDTIKEAVAGRRGGEERANEFAEDEEMRKFSKEAEESEDLQTMRKPLMKETKSQSFSDLFPKFGGPKTEESEEPIFVRIDKFENGSKEFEEVKKKVAEIEIMFENLKKVKEKEEKELEFWEEEIRNIKDKIEKIDQNIFSRVY